MRKETDGIPEIIAREANISGGMYVMIENGERNQSVHVAKNIARVLNFVWTLF
ncbi:transcriptional regulator [Bacillus cereus]|nr:transcriptional regulator [Bacillus cereus]